MIKATYRGHEVLAVTDYDQSAELRYVWIQISRFGALKCLWVPMSTVDLQEEK